MKLSRGSLNALKNSFRRLPFGSSDHGSDTCKLTLVCDRKG